ncbi:MAG: hypothetical protein HKP58_20425 [Desulfatitalea sp.]|nr:hypothetical protein [Desulfatitalea sp.]NNK02785.1 hypothetical protein [Desulfatitalea sp.]
MGVVILPLFGDQVVQRGLEPLQKIVQVRRGGKAQGQHGADAHGGGLHGQAEARFDDDFKRLQHQLAGHGRDHLVVVQPVDRVPVKGFMGQKASQAAKRGARVVSDAPQQPRLGFPPGKESHARRVQDILAAPMVVLDIKFAKSVVQPEGVMKKIFSVSAHGACRRPDVMQISC